jgi:hypothetical protein
VAEPGTRYEFNGASVELTGLIGTNANREAFIRTNVGSLGPEDRQRHTRLMNAEWGRGSVDVVLSAEVISADQRLVFVGATDEQGRSFKLVWQGEPGDDERSRRLVPYTYVLRPPEGAHEINLVVAVSQSRFFEFIAKPEQVSD